MAATTGHCGGHRHYTKGCLVCQQVTREYQTRHPRYSRATGIRPQDLPTWDLRPGREHWARMAAIALRVGAV